MSREKIDVKSGMLFPWYFQLLALIMVVVAIPLFADRTILAAALFLLGVLILSSYSGIEIDIARKVYKEYMSFLLIKKGKDIKYDVVERLYINKSRTRQQIYTRHTGHSSTFITESYDAYALFDNGARVHLLSNRNKERLKKRLHKVSAFLNVSVADNTQKS